MTKKITMEDDVRTYINDELRTFGYEIGGASKAPGDRWWITLKRGCSASYDGQKVANFLMKKLNVNDIVLDSRLFTLG